MSSLCKTPDITSQKDKRSVEPKTYKKSEVLQTIGSNVSHRSKNLLPKNHEANKETRALTTKNTPPL